MVAEKEGRLVKARGSNPSLSPKEAEAANHVESGDEITEEDRRFLEEFSNSDRKRKLMWKVCFLSRAADSVWANKEFC